MDNPLITTSEIPVERILQGELLSCSARTPLVDAARLMQAQRCSCIVVMEAGRAVGIWTEADVRELDFADPSVLQRPISAVMSSPVKTVSKHTPLSEIGMRFKLNQLRHYLVVDDEDMPLGIVTQSDVIRYQGIEHYLYLRDVRSALRRAPLIIDAHTLLVDAVRQMQARSLDAAAVRRADGFGILTERDLVRLISEQRTQGSVSEIASPHLLSVSQDCSLLSARNLLEQEGVRHLGVTDAHGDLLGLLSFGDILASVEYEYVNRLRAALQARDEALKASAENLRLAQRVIEASLDGIIITDSLGVIQSVNPRFTELTGYSAEEVIGQKPSLLSSGYHDRAFYEAMWQQIRSQGFWQGEVWNRRKNGEVYPEWLTITAIKDDDGNIRQYAAIFSDITDRKRNEERIKNLAYFDELTGLPNRRLFLDRLNLALANAHRHRHQLAVLFLDLDMFKRINDSLGHTVGDQVLKSIAQRLQAALREGDTVARLGGDEFTVMVPEVHEVDDVAALARRLIRVVEEPLRLAEAQELYLSTSIGISVYPQDGDTFDTLLKHADVAMYRAKELGRNGYQLYNDSMNEYTCERLALENSLRRAIRNEEFLLYYQPKLDLASGRLAGLEALIRWPDPERGGMISPAEFIPVAEDLGLISAIGDWVLREACRQQMAWQQQGYPLVPVAVNLSVQQFKEEHVIPTVKRALQESGLAPRWLELEITESCFMADAADAIARVMHELQAMGVSISIDDFGTGYSCLSYLKRLPLDALKVDASFVRDVPHSKDDTQIVRTIIAMAHGLGLRVIAEGVETAEQKMFLMRQGCHELQGYLYARPMPAQDIPRWLRELAEAVVVD